MDHPRRGSGRPHGLRGREIGMYYRNLALKRKKEESPSIHLGPSVSVPPGILARVDDYLLKFSQKIANDKVTNEFEESFRHLLDVDFEEFIAESKRFFSQPFDDVFSNQLLKSEMLAKERTEEFRRRFEDRSKLPTMKQQQRILDDVRNHQVVLIVGSTGCGKTTQVPQLLLDDYIFRNEGSQCRVVCTQPRRISAVSVAERVAYERCEKIGVSVGYQIRLESQEPREQGCILYCTTGILLQKMQSNPLLKGLNVVILDEIHERNVETDLLMALLKKILPHRPDLKVILMSATVSEDEFRSYFDQCHTLRIDGTLFPVKTIYLEDILQETGYTRFQNTPSVGMKSGHYKKQDRRNMERNQQYSFMIESYLRTIRDKYDPQVLQALRCSDSEGCDNLQFLEYLIFYICEHKPPGAILVFLPGYDKISKLNAALEKPTLPIGQRFHQKIQVYPLHSMMPTINQKSVFLPAPPGIRKIILSTIIAETSVTIDDVVYVINTGRTKVSNYDPEANIQTLEETWATKANSQQRQGRAGRVQPGICYNLYTKARDRLLDEVPTPEILRCKLEAIILNLKLLHVKDVFAFMKTLITVPDELAIYNGIKLLKRIDALDESGILTPLGMHLAHLPIDPQMAKMIVMAALFRCLDPITSVAAGLSFKSPFYTPLGQEKKVDRTKHDLAANTHSDHLLLDNVLLKFREAQLDGCERDFCYKNFLSISTIKQLEDMKKQFAMLLKRVSFIESDQFDDKSSNVNSGNITLLRAIIAAGLYPNIAQLRKVRQVKNHTHAIHSMSTPEEPRINFHPSSVNCGEPSFDSHYFVYYQKQKSSALYLLDATMVFPMALIIFGDGVETGFTPDKTFYITVAHCYHFKCDQNTASVVMDLRRRIKWLMQKKALYPSPITPNSGEECLIKAIQILLSLDDVYDYAGGEYVSTDDDMSF